MKPLSIESHLAPDVVDLLAVLSLNGDAPGNQADAGGDAHHLEACAVCRTAVTDRAAALLAERDAVSALIDASSTDAALEAQRRAIAARLAAQRDNSRVLEFPARAGRPAHPDRPGFRWLAAAAAAGLFVGILAGPRVQPLGWMSFSTPQPQSRVRSPLAPVSARDTRPIHPHDEVFLSEMETAVNNRSALPLRALDDLTPEPVSASVNSSR